MANKATARVFAASGMLAQALGHRQTSGFGGGAPDAEMDPGGDLGLARYASREPGRIAHA